MYIATIIGALIEVLVEGYCILKILLLSISDLTFIENLTLDTFEI